MKRREVFDVPEEGARSHRVGPNEGNEDGTDPQEGDGEEMRVRRQGQRLAMLVALAQSEGERVLLTPSSAT